MFSYTLLPDVYVSSRFLLLFVLSHFILVTCDLVNDMDAVSICIEVISVYKDYAVLSFILCNPNLTDASLYHAPGILPEKLVSLHCNR